MLDKQDAIRKAPDEILDALQCLAPLDPKTIWAAARKQMSKREFELFELATFLGEEADQAQKAGAYLASCLLCAAAVEALLAQMCLQREPDVTQTKQYLSSTRKKPKLYRQVIAAWSLEQLISVADELAWIPANIVDEKFRGALAEGYREVIRTTHPELGESEVEEGARSFIERPGPAMMRLTQSLRNSIHAGKWLRGRNRFVAENFVDWCKLGSALGTEIVYCLMYQMISQITPALREEIQRLNSMLDSLPPRLRTTLLERVKAELKL
jgi:hypothetical protein